MSYVSDHALYGVPSNYIGLGSVSFNANVELLQLAANRVATMKGWPTVTVDGKIGPNILALAQKIQQSSPMTIDPIADQAYLLSNAKAYADVFMAMAKSGGKVTGAAPPPTPDQRAASYSSSFVPANVAAQAQSAQWAVVGGKGQGAMMVPTASGAKAASTAQSYAPVAPPVALQQPLRAGFHLPSAKYLLLGGAALLVVLLLNRRGKSSSAAAAPAVPAVPKGV